jgi:hypothetical protein
MVFGNVGFSEADDNSYVQEINPAAAGNRKEFLTADFTDFTDLIIPIRLIRG